MYIPTFLVEKILRMWKILFHIHNNKHDDDDVFFILITSLP